MAERAQPAVPNAQGPDERSREQLPRLLRRQVAARDDLCGKRVQHAHLADLAQRHRGLQGTDGGAEGMPIQRRAARQSDVHL